MAVRIGHMADSGLVIRRVGEVRRMLVASPDYLAARGMPAAPADLARHMSARVRLFLDFAAARLSRLDVIRVGRWSAGGLPS